VEGYPRFTWLYEPRCSSFSEHGGFDPISYVQYHHKHVPIFVLRSRDFDLPLYRFSYPYYGDPSVKIYFDSNWRSAEIAAELLRKPSDVTDAASFTIAD